MKKLLLILILGISGCGSVSTQLHGPNGEVGYRIACARTSYQDCIDEAKQVCPTGYVAGGQFSHLQVNDLTSGNMQNSARVGLLIQCK